MNIGPMFDLDQELLACELRRLGATDRDIALAFESASDLDDWLGPYNFKLIESPLQGHYPRSWPKLPKADLARATLPEQAPRGPFYVYLWSLTGDGPFAGSSYVGKGSGRRYREHVTNVGKGDGRWYFTCCLYSHLLQGGSAHCEIIVDEIADDAEAYAREVAEIMQRGRHQLGTGFLLNLDAGGSGSEAGENHPMKRPEWRAKMKALWNNPDFRAKMIGRNSHLYRPDVRARINATNRSPEGRAKMSAKKSTPEARAKQRAVMAAMKAEWKITPGFKLGNKKRHCEKIFAETRDKDEYLRRCMAGGVARTTALIYYGKWINEKPSS